MLETIRLLQMIDSLKRPLGGQVGPRPMDEVPRPNIPDQIDPVILEQIRQMEQGAGQISSSQRTPPGIDPIAFRAAQQMEQQAGPLGQAPPEEEIGFAEQELRKMLGQMPVRGKPGVGRKIMGFLAGYGQGSTVGEKVTNAPYYRDLEAWENKLKPLKELADAEGQRRTNQRLIESSERTARIAQQKADQTAEYQKERIRVADANTAIAEFKAKNPGYESVVAKDGKLVLWHPVTGDTKETGIDTGKLDDATKLNMQIAGRLSEVAERGRQQRMNIAATGAETRKTEGTKQEGRESLEEIRQGNKLEQMEYGADIKTAFEGLRQSNRMALEKLNQSGAITLKQTSSGGIAFGAGSRGLQPSQQRIDRINRVMEIISASPELEPYYKIDDKGNVRVLPLDEVDTDGWFDDANPDDRLRAYQRLLAGEKNPAIAVPKSVTPVDTPIPAPPAVPRAPKQGRIKVIGPNGEKGTMEASELVNYPGWKEVK